MAPDSENTFKVTIEGPGLSITREVDANALTRVLQVILGSNGNGGALEDRSVEAHGLPSSPDVSLREFLTNCSAKRHPDKIVAIGHYIEAHEGQAGFSKDDIKARFRSAGEAPPGNFPRDFALALKNGWIAKDTKNSGQLYVTRSGQEAIQNHFSGISRQTRVKTRRRRSALGGYVRG